MAILGEISPEKMKKKKKKKGLLLLWETLPETFPATFWFWIMYELP